jgi:hypothetical protein
MQFCYRGNSNSNPGVHLIVATSNDYNPSAERHVNKMRPHILMPAAGGKVWTQ